MYRGIMNIKHMNSNLKSLLQHAAIISDIKSGIYRENKSGICITDYNDDDITCYFYIPPESYEIPSSYINPHDSLPDNLLADNIKSLAYHYITYFNLPKPDELIIFASNICYRIPSANHHVYRISKIIRLSGVFYLHNYYTIT